MGDIIVGVILLALVVTAVRKIKKNKGVCTACGDSCKSGKCH